VLALFATVLLTGILLVWLQFTWVLARIGRLPDLGRAPAEMPDGMAWPRLSVVLACRNEEAAIRKALSSLLAQDYPPEVFEVIAVDDRSEDATGAILGELCAAHPALRVARVDELPSGWLGKTHALHRGAAEATGDWILFTDADVVFRPDALRRAVAWTVRDGLGHVVALPHFIAPGVLERGFVSLFGLFLLLHLRVDELRRPGSAAHVGIGAFNLVRRESYQAIGGHERLRLEVADDVKLGLVLRRSGVRQGCADSGGLVRVRWQLGFVASMRGLLKNFFAGSDYSWLTTMRTVALVPLITTFPAVYLAISIWSSPAVGTRLLAALAVALPVTLLGATARRLAGGRGPEGLLLPLLGVCLALVALLSALLAALRGAVIWRGTRYALCDLRAGGVRDADWPADGAPG
jgi:glycosyltransferase involved in cell wall biosynthesis